MFTRAIVRTPGKSMVDGISGSGLGKPDFSLALEQHHQYVKALTECGLDVTILDADERFPDSVFVEDVALLTDRCAIITSPGAESRRGEEKAIRKTIEKIYTGVEEIVYPGTVEAGDIMMVNEHYYIGLSERTNPAGARQLVSILQSYGFTGSLVSLETMLHLKSGVSYLENNNMLVYGEMILKKEFSGFNKIVVPDKEGYSANSVWINGRVLIPEGYPETTASIESLGYKAVLLNMSEFRKLDGGLSCMSLRF